MIKLNDIAVVGLAARLPGADSVDAFWDNLASGRSSIETSQGTFPSGTNYVPVAAFPKNIELFDAAFFGITPREAEMLDPQHRLLLECAWEVFENSGYDPTTYKGKIGVYAGCALNTYLLCNLMQRRAYLDDSRLFQMIVSSNSDFLATRISYKLNLRGPSHTVQSACSTSLLAIHVACRSLQIGECDMALAGGVALNLKLREGYPYVEGGIFSADGFCRAFDADANGTVFGNGAGIVLLKPLEAAMKDGDSISAIIRGSAVNNDGALKVGYTAPGLEGQAEVILEALRNADVHPESVTYVESHGTGTPLGDPIEIAALTRAYTSATTKRSYCAIGSVKTNIGHLDAAAGVAGFIKTVLAIKHRQLPPTLHFRKANPQIDFASTPFYVNASLKEWTTEDQVRRAGVSAFGVGGTNVHLILEEAPRIARVRRVRPWHLVRLSARSGAALRAIAVNLNSWLHSNKDVDLADLAYTLQVGRKTLEYRQFIVCSSFEDLETKLFEITEGTAETRREERNEGQPAFVFPGLESLYVNAGRELYEGEPVFREWLDRCSTTLLNDGHRDIRPILYPSEDLRAEAEELLERPEFAQPALFSVEYALARLWMHWGVVPASLVGHGLGEYVAACVSGVFAPEDILRLVATQARLVQELPHGNMLAVYCDDRTIAGLFEDDRALALAAINSSGQCVLSGSAEAIGRSERRLAEEGIQYRRIRRQDALHSSTMDAVSQTLQKLFANIPMSAPNLPFVSGTTGRWITPAQATSLAYWTQHLSQTVRFHDALGLAAERSSLFLEVGPGDALTRLIRRRPDRTLLKLEAFATLQPPESATFSVLQTAGSLWLNGVPVQTLFSGADDRLTRIALPSYPFERSRHWIDPDPPGEVPGSTSRAEPAVAASHASLHSRPELPTSFAEPISPTERRLATLWQITLGIGPIGATDNFFDLGGDSLIAVELITRLKAEFSGEISAVDLYEKLTIRMLGEYLDQLNQSDGAVANQEPTHLRSAAEGREVQRTLRARRQLRQVVSTPTE